MIKNYNVVGYGGGNTISITGLSEVCKKLEETDKKYGEKLVNAVEAVSIEIVNDAKIGPHRGNYGNPTGNLRNSINYQLETNEKGIVSTIFAGMEYAIYVEFMVGYWVLGSAWFFAKPKILSRTADYIRRQK